jgi:hypothetical protein
MPLKTTDWKADADDGALCRYYLTSIGRDVAAIVEQSRDNRFSWYAYSSSTQGGDCIVKQGKRYSQQDAKKAADRALQQIIAASTPPEPAPRPHAPWPEVVETLAALGWTLEAVQHELERLETAKQE